MNNLLTLIFGKASDLIYIYVCTMLLDIFSGYLLALRKRKWSSKISNTGIWKKCANIILMMIGAVLDSLLVKLNIHLDWSIAALFTALLIVTELGSIVGNISPITNVQPFKITIAKIILYLEKFNIK